MHRKIISEWALNFRITNHCFPYILSNNVAAIARGTAMSFGGGCRSVDHSVLTADFNLRSHNSYQAIYDFWCAERPERVRDAELGKRPWWVRSRIESNAILSGQIATLLRREHPALPFFVSFSFYDWICLWFGWQNKEGKRWLVAESVDGKTEAQRL